MVLETIRSLNKCSAGHSWSIFHYWCIECWGMVEPIACQAKYLAIFSLLLCIEFKLCQRRIPLPSIQGQWIKHQWNNGVYPIDPTPTAQNDGHWGKICNLYWCIQTGTHVALSDNKNSNNAFICWHKGWNFRGCSKLMTLTPVHNWYLICQSPKGWKARSQPLQKKQQ